MTTDTSKTPRLLAAAKEFNIGKDTLVDFLTDKGFEVISSPRTKLTEQMYNALTVEFAQDKAAKKKSESIALPKGPMLDNIKKTKEELDITAKDKKEEPKAEPKKEEKPKVAEAPKPVVEEPKPAPKAKEPEVAAPVAAKVEEPAPTPAPAPPKQEEEPKATPKAKEPEATTPEHLDVKAPKIEGPNILGKINLD